MKVLITQSNYIPWKGYFDAINNADIFVVYDEMQYTKRDWRNRNQIKTQNGLKWLSIPVQTKGKFTQKINETKTLDSLWQNQHLKTLLHNYAYARNFKTVSTFIEKLYSNIPSSNLSEINQYFINGICNYLSIKTKMVKSKDFKLVGEKSEKLLNICLELGASTYLTGPASLNYLNSAIFENKQIQVEYLDYNNYPEYEQLYGDFSHNVSILDLIFMEGDNSGKFLKTFDNRNIK